MEISPHLIDLFSLQLFLKRGASTNETNLYIVIFTKTPYSTSPSILRRSHPGIDLEDLAKMSCIKKRQKTCDLMDTQIVFRKKLACFLDFLRQNPSHGGKTGTALEFASEGAFAHKAQIGENGDFRFLQKMLADV